MSRRNEENEIQETFFKKEEAYNITKKYTGNSK